MIINELFYSLQGEGRLAGVPSVFVRLAGCPLRCRWCDTKYAWDTSAGREYSAEQVLERINEFPTRYIVITGGEPVVHPGFRDLVDRIAQEEYHITVETAGIEYLQDLPVQLVSISPKLRNSIPENPEQACGHESLRFNQDILRQFMNTYDYQLKFVVDKPEDLDEIAEVLSLLNNVDPYKIYLMPQSTNLEDYIDKSRWLAEYCKQTGFAFSPRLQVMLWPSERGK